MYIYILCIGIIKLSSSEIKPMILSDNVSCSDFTYNDLFFNRKP